MHTDERASMATTTTTTTTSVGAVLWFSYNLPFWALCDPALTSAPSIWTPYDSVVDECLVHPHTSTWHYLGYDQGEPATTCVSE
jgi:hypothetical protein